MSNLSLMPAYLLHEWTNSGLPLSGGTLSFYESGTLTPKAVYSTAVGDVSLGSVVTLSASGTATVFLGEGAYRIWLKDAAGVQIAPWVDGIVDSGAGFASGSNASIAIVKTYADLRALTSTPDVVWVCGRSEEGDGGEGAFQLLPLSTLVDDDGIILTAASGTRVYKRVFDAAINPQWYGVTYGVSQDQAIYLQGALAGSVQFDFPVMTTGSVYISSNITVPNGAGIYCSTDGYFRSGSTITMTFQTGSHFDGISTSFGQGVSPIFAASGIADAIKLSWMGGSDTEKWTKLVGSSTANYILQADISTSVYSDITVPANFSLDFISAAKLTFTAFANLDIQRFIYSGKSQVIQFDAMSYVGTVNIGSDKSYIEWFGGSSGGDANLNAIAFKAVAMNGYWDLLVNSNYTITNTTGYSTSKLLTINGNDSEFELNQDIVVSDLKTNNVTISGTGSLTFDSMLADGTTSTISLTGEVSSINSDLSNITLLVYASNSVIRTVTNIKGNINNSNLIANNVHVIDELYYNEGSIDSTSSDVIFIFEDIVNYSKFNNIQVNVNGTLLYSNNSNLIVDVVACVGKNWNVGPTEIRQGYPSYLADSCRAIHNGVATVNVTGTNVRGNTTASTIDGISQRLWAVDPGYRSKGIKIDTPVEIPTSSISKWYGVGVPSMSSDGTSITTGVDLTLSNTPWSSQTIRYAGLNADGSGTMSKTLDLVWRVGGQMVVTIQYPGGGVTPDPNTKLCVAFVSPSLPVSGSMIMGLSTHQIFGVCTPVNLPSIASSTISNYVNIWGGQTTLSLPPILGAITVADEWGDVSVAVGSGGSIPGIPRIVIYNAGTGTIPMGTKITIEIGAYAPTREQYNNYWPDTPFGNIPGTAFQHNGGGGVGLAGLYKFPYVYRQSDDNGLQVAKARPNFNSTPIDLPLTVWTNGTTLNGSYS